MLTTHSKAQFREDTNSRWYFCSMPRPFRTGHCISCWSSGSYSASHDICAEKARHCCVHHCFVHRKDVTNYTNARKDPSDSSKDRLGWKDLPGIGERKNHDWLPLKTSSAMDGLLGASSGATFKRMKKNCIQCLCLFQTRSQFLTHAQTNLK